MQYIEDAITQEGFPKCYADNITEIFGPTGLVKSNPNATKRPAFNTLRDAIKPLREGRHPSTN
jgi:hypothetical protein